MFFFFILLLPDLPDKKDFRFIFGLNVRNKVLSMSSITTACLDHTALCEPQLFQTLKNVFIHEKNTLYSSVFYFNLCGKYAYFDTFYFRFERIEQLYGYGVKLWTVLGRGGDDVPDGDDVGMVERTEMFDVSLLDITNLLDGHLIMTQTTQEHGALRTTAQPRQIRDVLERYLPVVVYQAIVSNENHRVARKKVITIFSGLLLYRCVKRLSST